MFRNVSIDIYMCIVLIIMSIFLYIESTNYVAQVGFYPRLILLSILGLSLCAIAETIIKVLKNSSNKKSLSKSQYISVLIVAIFSVSYGIALSILGLFISTLLFIFCYMLYLGCRDIKINILSFIVFFSFIYSVFIILLKIPFKIFPFS